MPQPKQHKNAAERQAAYRRRKPKPPAQARLAQLARAVDDIIAVDCKSPDRKLPANIVGTDTEKTLRNLICWLDPVKDTVRHPDWDLFHP